MNDTIEFLLGNSQKEKPTGSDLFDVDSTKDLDLGRSLGILMHFATPLITQPFHLGQKLAPFLSAHTFRGYLTQRFFWTRWFVYATQVGGVGGGSYKVHEKRSGAWYICRRWRCHIILEISKLTLRQFWPKIIEVSLRSF